MTLNNVQHATTGATPHKIWFSRCEDAVLPLDMLTGKATPHRAEYSCEREYVAQQSQVCQEICDVVRQSIQKQAKVQASGRLRSGLKIRQYKEGDWVWRLCPPHERDKLNPSIWLGPYQVLDVDDTCHVIKIRVPAPGRGNRMILKWIHTSNVKPVKFNRDGHMMQVQVPEEDWFGEGQRFYDLLPSQQ